MYETVNLACFYPASVFCAWSVSTGLVDTLQRMGHETLALPIDASSVSLKTALYPSQEQLGKFDGIIISGPEHIRPHLLALYPNWANIHVPKVSWMHETVEREDYGKLPIEAIKTLSDQTFCPAAQDEKFGMRWLPFGVDTGVFKPDFTQSLKYDAAFVGLLYPKRVEFLKKLVPLLNGISFLAGNVQVQDLSGICVRETAALYAHNLRQIKLFVNLPTLSQLAVTKVYEVLACGTFLITPSVTEPRNFENIPAHFYDSGRPEELVESIRFCMREDKTRAEAARQCCTLIHREHRLELRCETLLSALKGTA